MDYDYYEFPHSTLEMARASTGSWVVKDLKPAKKQKQPQYWVIESMRPLIDDEWHMATEQIASGKEGDENWKITPRRLTTAVNILRAHVDRYQYVLGEEVRYRLRNLKTGEIIPAEGLDIGGR